jgi:hypothetical protein
MRRNHCGDIGIDGRIILDWILEKRCDGVAEFMWLRIGNSGGILYTP